MQSRNTNTKARFIMGLSFILVDILLILILLGFNAYAGLPSFLETVLRNIWIVLLGGAFILMAATIIVAKDYELIRRALYQGLLTILFGIWLGISRLYILSMDSVANDSLVLFNLGSLIIILLMVLCHVDMIWGKAIQNILLPAKTTNTPPKTRPLPAEGQQRAPQSRPPQQRPTTDTPRRQRPASGTAKATTGQGRTTAPQQPAMTSTAKNPKVRQQATTTGRQRPSASDGQRPTTQRTNPQGAKSQAPASRPPQSATTARRPRPTTAAPTKKVEKN